MTKVCQCKYMGDIKYLILVSSVYFDYTTSTSTAIVVDNDYIPLSNVDFYL